MNNFENLAAKKGEKCSAGDVRLSRKLTTWKCADISSQLTTGEKKTKINGKKAPAANRLILHKKEKKKRKGKRKRTQPSSPRPIAGRHLHISFGAQTFWKGNAPLCPNPWDRRCTSPGVVQTHPSDCGGTGSTVMIGEVHGEIISTRTHLTIAGPDIAAGHAQVVGPFTSGGGARMHLPRSVGHPRARTVGSVFGHLHHHHHHHHPHLLIISTGRRSTAPPFLLLGVPCYDLP